LVTRGKAAPRTFVNRRAGPSAATTRRWISAASRRASTGASTTVSSPRRRSASRNARRAGNVTALTGAFFPLAPASQRPPARRKLGGRPVRRVARVRARTLVLPLLHRLRLLRAAVPGGVAAAGHGPLRRHRGPGRHRPLRVHGRPRPRQRAGGPAG